VIRRIGAGPGRAARALPVLFAVLASGCRDREPHVLTVGDVGFTSTDLGPITPAQRDELAAVAGLGLAWAGGREMDVARPLIERERRARLLRRLPAAVALREAGIDEAALRELYEQSPEYELVVRHLVILAERWRAPAERAVARERAEAALRRIQAGEDFATVAAELSDEPGAAERGGLLRPGREGSWVPEFWTAASALPAGAHSGVVETEFGFHVLRLEERRPVPLDEVRGRVLQRFVDATLVQDAAAAWVQRETAALVLDTAAVRAYGPVAAAGSEAAGAPETARETVLARWPGGDYRAAELQLYLAGLTPEELARVAGAGEAGYLRVVEGAARNALLAGRAVALGLELDAEEARRLREEHAAALGRLAQALGFRRGQPPAEVRETALSAFASTRQGQRIARQAVVAMAPAIFAVHAPRPGAADR
jgi:hypothetical protein